MPLLDQDFWEGVLEPYAANPGVAFAMAQTFAILQNALKDPDGTKEVVQSLEHGIRELYRYTDFHQACFRLYLQAISPRGLLPKHDPTFIVEELDKPKRLKKPNKGMRSKRKSGRRVRR